MGSARVHHRAPSAQILTGSAASFDGPYSGKRSAHLGTYRVVYQIVEADRTVIVLAIRLRGDVYGVRWTSEGRQPRKPPESYRSDHFNDMASRNP